MLTHGFREKNAICVFVFGIHQTQVGHSSDESGVSSASHALKGHERGVEMMGIINNLLLQFVEEAAGADARKAILDKAGFTMFRSEENYPDAAWQRLVTTTVEHLGMDGVEAQKAFARWCFPVLVKQFGPFFKSAKSTQQFMEKVPRIHRDFPSASVKEFVEKIHVKQSSPGLLVWDYESSNRLVPFMIELGKSVSGHYGEEVTASVKEMGENHWEVEWRFSAARNG